MHAKRRQVLGGMLAAAALGVVGRDRLRAGTASSNGPASQGLPLPMQERLSGAAPPFDPSRLASRSQVWSWVETLNSFGPRLTGTDAHRRAIEFLAAELQAAGLTVQRDTDTRHFRLWQARRWSLELVADGVAAAVPVAFYFPYSGETSTQGLTGELVYFDAVPSSFTSAAGKIAVIDVPTPALSWLFQYLMFSRRSTYPDDSADFHGSMSTPLLGGTLKAGGVNLKAAAAAGVLGVVCVWRGCSERTRAVNICRSPRRTRVVRPCGWALRPAQTLQAARNAARRHGSSSRPMSPSRRQPIRCLPCCGNQRGRNHPHQYAYRRAQRLRGKWRRRSTGSRALFFNAAREAAAHPGFCAGHRTFSVAAAGRGRAGNHRLVACAP